MVTGRGGTHYLIALSSLPPGAQARYWTEKAGCHTGQATPEDLQTFLSSRRISLSPAQLADPRWQKKIGVYMAVNAIPAYQGKERAIAAHAQENNVAPVTIRRWMEAVEKLQVNRTPRVTIGNEPVEIPNSHSFTTEALAYGLSFYASNPRAGMKTAFFAMKEHAATRSWNVGDYSTFTRIVAKFPAPLYTRLRRGATGFELQCVPKIIRAWTKIPCQSVLCGDQKIFDYVTYDPELDDGTENASGLILPEGYFWMDCASRMITGVSIEFGHYNRYTVGSSLREALRYGIPDEVFTDWGKPEQSDYTAQIVQGLTGRSATGNFLDMQERFGDMSDDDDVFHRKAQAGKPWTKPIENVMNILDTRLKQKNIPGFRKRSNDPWENKEIQKLLLSQAHHGRLMTITDFVTTVFTVVDEHNRAEKQLKEGGSIVPLDFFDAGLRAQNRPVLDRDTLDWICLPRFDRKPQQAVVRLKMGRDDERGYTAPVLSGLKEKVWLSVDPYDRMAPALITSLDGEFLGAAEPWHVQDPYDKPELARKRTRQAELKKWVREQADRLRHGFGLLKEDAPPVRITAETKTAVAAKKAKKVYELRTDNWKMAQKDRTRQATEVQSAIKAELEASAQPAFTPPPEPKERYRIWLKLNTIIASGHSLTEPEEEFWRSYKNGREWELQKTLHEDFGQMYVGAQAAQAGPSLITEGE